MLKNSKLIVESNQIRYFSKYPFYKSVNSLEQSLRMALEYDKYRIPYRLIMFEGRDHGIWEHRERVDEEVLSWFNHFLKNGEVLSEMEFHGR